MADLTGKAAIVTGASRGIGRAIAVRLAQDGASVLVHYGRDSLKAAQTVALCGSSSCAAQADLTQVAEVRRLFADADEAFGRLDILVNNAGDAYFSPLADVTEADFDALFALNARGVFFAMQEAARRMERGGRIVNLSSGITQFGGAHGALYGGTKGAVEQFTLAAAKELGPHGITVNTVSPGMTETDLLHRAVPAEAQKQMTQSIPLGRLGQPDDIADVVAFLVSDAARWLTGQNIRATGGAG